MELNIGKPASMNEILQSREQRCARQNTLINKFNLPIVSLTVNIPGSVKLIEKSIKIFNVAFDEITSILSQYIRYSEKEYLISGCQGYFVVDMPAKKLKELMCNLEDNHALGRLFDADVIDINMSHLSRRDMNIAERKCLICNQPATFCARSRNHSVEALLTEIDRIFCDWENIL